MTRKEEIEQANPFYNIEPPTVMDSGIKYGFGIGAKWADEHPSEETIKKVINDFMAIYGKRDGGYEGIDNAVERIKEHWNDE